MFRKDQGGKHHQIDAGNIAIACPLAMANVLKSSARTCANICARRLPQQACRSAPVQQRPLALCIGRRTLHSTTQNIDSDTSQPPPPSPQSSTAAPPSSLNKSSSLHAAARRRATSPLKPSHSPQYDPSRAPSAPALSGTLERPRLSQNLRDTLPLLAAQAPHYATIHIHGKPYLVTEGDVVRLPFLMHGVAPGDVIRLNRVTIIGSRDWTLQGGTAVSSITPNIQDTGRAFPSTTTEPSLIIGKTEGLSQADLPGNPTARDPEVGRTAGLQKAGPAAYVDESLYTIRAVVTGTESEPLRIKEKKKQRNRHLRTIKSKHRFTMLRIKELRVADGAEGDFDAA